MLGGYEVNVGYRYARDLRRLLSDYRVYKPHNTIVGVR